MLPLIRPGDCLVVVPVVPNCVTVGDVIVWLDGRRLIAHRVIRVFARDGRRMFQSQGDARSRPDPARPIERVLGRVVTIERSLPGKEVIPVDHRRKNAHAGV
jgi:hypothetical protein